MAAFLEGTVVRILSLTGSLVRVEAELASGRIEAVGFPFMLGPIEPGDRVVINTTGLELELGTGGDGFLLWNLDGAGTVQRGEGHIVKMRHTPWQTEVAAVEAQESPHHPAMEKATSIEGTPVVACGLHSQIAGVAAGIRERRPRARIGYVMTDGGALPLAWSQLVAALQREGLIDSTCTVGHAFGGELEAVNVFSGLVAARVIGKADAIIVGMGPGVTGTDTALGFSAIEQGQILNAVAALDGRPIATLRVSMADQRARHKGLSHHTVTSLTIACQTRVTVAMPQLEEEPSQLLWEQLRSSGVCQRHSMVVADGRPGLEELRAIGLEVRSMGRTSSESPEGFLAAAAAGALAADAISERDLRERPTHSK
jgi:hypothetical protein